MLSQSKASIQQGVAPSISSSVNIDITCMSSYCDELSGCVVASKWFLSYLYSVYEKTGSLKI